MADEKVTKLETEETLETMEARLTDKELDDVVGGDGGDDWIWVEDPYINVSARQAK